MAEEDLDSSWWNSLQSPAIAGLTDGYYAPANSYAGQTSGSSKAYDLLKLTEETTGLNLFYPGEEDLHDAARAFVSGGGGGGNDTDPPPVTWSGSGGSYSSVDQESLDRQSANLLSKEYERAANDQLQSAIAAQQALAEQAEFDKNTFNKLVKVADRTKNVADANARESSNDDYFSQLVNLQGMNRSFKNSSGGSYGSINNTREDLIRRQDANTTAELASNLRTNLQNNRDTWTSSYNNSLSDYRTNAQKRAASQSEINREYAQGVSNLASSFYSGISGLSTEDVRNEWIDSDGNRLNEANWMQYGDVSNRPSDLYESSKWTDGLEDYKLTTKEPDVISKNAHDTVYNQYKDKSNNWAKLYSYQ